MGCVIGRFAVLPTINYFRTVFIPNRSKITGSDNNNERRGRPRAASSPRVVLSARNCRPTPYVGNVTGERARERLRPNGARQVNYAIVTDLHYSRVDDRSLISPIAGRSASPQARRRRRTTACWAEAGERTSPLRRACPAKAAKWRALPLVFGNRPHTAISISHLRSVTRLYAYRIDRINNNINYNN